MRKQCAILLSLIICSINYIYADPVNCGDAEEINGGCEIDEETNGSEFTIQGDISTTADSAEGINNN